MNRRPKYGNIRTELDGVTFDSRKEARRYQDLLLMERAGLVKNIERQPRYEIKINDVHVCWIVPDFRYQDKERGLVVEDVKSEITRKQPVYRLKAKLMRAVHGVEVREV